MRKRWQKEERLDSIEGEPSRRLRIWVSHGEGWRFCLDETTSERSQKGSMSSGEGREKELKEQDGGDVAFWKRWNGVIDFEGEARFSR